MPSKVTYKFKSARDFDFISFNGNFITLGDLTQRIVERKRLMSKQGQDFELVLSNAATREVYRGDDTRIPKNVQIIVQRVPVIGGGLQAKILRNQSGASHTAMSAAAAGNPGQTMDVFDEEDLGDDDGLDGNAGGGSAAGGNADDSSNRLASKIAQMASQKSRQMKDQMRRQRGRQARSNMSGPPGSSISGVNGYSGFGRQHAQNPAQGNKGIPKSFLANSDSAAAAATAAAATTATAAKTTEAAAGEEAAGANAAATDGAPAQAPSRSAGWGRFQSDSKFQERVKADGGVTSRLSDDELRKRIDVASVPKELLCELTGRLIRDAVVLPCCNKACSAEDIQEALVKSQFVCPLCQTKNISLDQLRPNYVLRKRVADFLEDQRDKLESGAALEKERAAAMTENERQRRLMDSKSYSRPDAILDLGAPKLEETHEASASADHSNDDAEGETSKDATTGDKPEDQSGEEREGGESEKDGEQAAAQSGDNSGHTPVSPSGSTGHHPSASSGSGWGQLSSRNNNSNNNRGPYEPYGARSYDPYGRNRSPPSNRYAPPDMRRRPYPDDGYYNDRYDYDNRDRPPYYRGYPRRDRSPSPRNRDPRGGWDYDRRSPPRQGGPPYNRGGYGRWERSPPRVQGRSGSPAYPGGRDQGWDNRGDPRDYRGNGRRGGRPDNNIDRRYPPRDYSPRDNEGMRPRSLSRDLDFDNRPGDRAAYGGGNNDRAYDRPYDDDDQDQDEDFRRRGRSDADMNGTRDDGNQDDSRRSPGFDQSDNVQNADAGSQGQAENAGDDTGDGDNQSRQGGNHVRKRRRGNNNNNSNNRQQRSRRDQGRSGDNGGNGNNEQQPKRQRLDNGRNGGTNDRGNSNSNNSRRRGNNNNNNNNGGNNNNNNNNNNNTYFTGVGSLGGRGNFGQLSAGNGGSNKSSTYGASSPTESVRTSGLSVGRDYNDGSYGDVKQSIPAGASARNGNNAGNDHTEAGYKISGAPSSKPFHTVSQGNGGAANNNNNNNNKTAIQVKTEEKERDDHLDRDSKSPSASSPAAVSRAELSAGLHSLELFLRFVKEYPDPEMPSRTIIDTSQILSSECYEAWIATRRGSLKKPEESFRRALTAHVTGADRRRPFPPHVEASLLIELRKQKTWPCFEGRMSQNENKPIKIGEQGFRTHGYHERKASEAKDSQQRADRNISPSNFSSSPLQANNMSAPVHPVPLMLNGRANPGHGHQQPFATGQQSHHHQPQQQQQQQQQHFSRFPPAMQQHLQQQQLQQQQHQQHPSQDASLGSRNTSGGAYSIGNAGAADKSGSRGSSLGNMVVSNFFPQSIIDNLQSNGSSASSSSYPGGGNPQAFLSRSGAPPYSNVYSNQASPLHKRKDHDGVDNNPAKRQHFSLR